MRKFIIMGIQGSGKGTQAKLLADDLDLEHISVGDIFRWNVQHHTKLGAQVKRIMASGHLVGDDLVESVVRERLTAHDWNFGFIVDGFPRNARQAEFFLESYDIDGVINLHLARRGGPPPGAGPSAVLPVRAGLQPDRPPAATRDTCDVCQGTLVARADDNPEALAVRLSEYHEQTRPLIEIFQRKEYVATIDATQGVEEVQAAIRARFGLPARPAPGADLVERSPTTERA